MKNNYWSGKKVLITGHEGFLGSHLARMLLERGARITGVDKVKGREFSVLNGLRKDITCVRGDISSLTLVKKLFNIYKPQIVFNIAAEAIVGEANKNPVKAFKSNIEGTWNILEASRWNKSVEAIVSASSDKAYGSHKVLPYKENAPLMGEHPYDVSKSCADLICRTYYKTYNVPVCVTRCGNIYGPGDFNFSRIVPDAIRCAINGETLVIRSDGKFTRDYIYIDDIVSGYMLLAEKMSSLKLYGEAFNFSNESPVSVLELVKLISKLAGQKRPDYKITNQARCEIIHQFLSAVKARKILKWKPEYKLEQGLKKTIKWYKDYFGAK